MNDELPVTPPTAAPTKSPYCVNLKDITGQRFGRLVVLRREGKNISGQATWRCLCDCGHETVQAGSTLRAGIVVSCGCYHAEVFHNRKHMMSGHPLYIAFKAMHFRVREESSQRADYFDRGIIVCEKWQTFEGFLEDMRESFVDGLTLDRRDVNGNYCKDNCRWVTMTVQNNNKRNNVRITHLGETMTSAEWARIGGISLPTFRARRKAGWPMEKILSTSPDLYHGKGEVKS